jgi:hypothetical protein
MPSPAAGATILNLAIPEDVDPAVVRRAGRAARSVPRFVRESAKRQSPRGFLVKRMPGRGGDA